MEAKLLDRKVVDAHEFGDLVLQSVHDLARTLFPQVTDKTFDVALPFRVTFDPKGEICTCRMVCTHMGDGGIECNWVCTGNCN
jgi:hypothetical protein